MDRDHHNTHHLNSNNSSNLFLEFDQLLMQKELTMKLFSTPSAQRLQDSELELLEQSTIAALQQLQASESILSSSAFSTSSAFTSAASQFSSSSSTSAFSHSASSSPSSTSPASSSSPTSSPFTFPLSSSMSATGAPPAYQQQQQQASSTSSSSSPTSTHTVSHLLNHHYSSDAKAGYLDELYSFSKGQNKSTVLHWRTRFAIASHHVLYLFPDDFPHTLPTSTYVINTGTSIAKGQSCDLILFSGGGECVLRASNSIEQDGWIATLRDMASQTFPNFAARPTNGGSSNAAAVVSNPVSSSGSATKSPDAATDVEMEDALVPPMDEVVPPTTETVPNAAQAAPMPVPKVSSSSSATAAAKPTSSSSSSTTPPPPVSQPIPPPRSSSATSSPPPPSLTPSSFYSSPSPTARMAYPGPPPPNVAASTMENGGDYFSIPTTPADANLPMGYSAAGDRRPSQGSTLVDGGNGERRPSHVSSFGADQTSRERRPSHGSTLVDQQMGGVDQQVPSLVGSPNMIPLRTPPPPSVIALYPHTGAQHQATMHTHEVPKRSITPTPLLVSVAKPANVVSSESPVSAGSMLQPPKMRARSHSASNVMVPMHFGGSVAPPPVPNLDLRAYRDGGVAGGVLMASPVPVGAYSPQQQQQQQQQLSNSNGQYIPPHQQPRGILRPVQKSTSMEALSALVIGQPGNGVAPRRSSEDGPNVHHMYGGGLPPPPHHHYPHQQHPHSHHQQQQPPMWLGAPVTLQHRLPSQEGTPVPHSPQQLSPYQTPPPVPVIPGRFKPSVPSPGSMAGGMGGGRKMGNYSMERNGKGGSSMADDDNIFRGSVHGNGGGGGYAGVDMGRGGRAGSNGGVGGAGGAGGVLREGRSKKWW
ncbi:hypothetical protein HDU97_008257 [Phlyctochytrium planicorne]|nr:hypothetical protein HDU97_008257 [Phlyctochytrium planicorne]